MDYVGLCGGMSRVSSVTLRDKGLTSSNGRQIISKAKGVTCRLCNSSCLNWVSPPVSAAIVSFLRLFRGWIHEEINYGDKVLSHEVEIIWKLSIKCLYTQTGNPQEPCAWCGTFHFSASAGNFSTNLKLFPLAQIQIGVFSITGYRLHHSPSLAWTITT